jgi:hypothetical protein
MIEINESAEWREATFSNGSGNCVEVALGSVVGVRDTKDRSAGYLALTPGSWQAFVAEVAAE